MYNRFELIREKGLLAVKVSNSAWAADFEGVLRHVGCSLLFTPAETWRYDWPYVPWWQAEARLVIEYNLV